VWSCIGWEMNQLEQKRQKTRSNPSDCSEGVFQRQRFLRKQQPISGFALISLFSLPAACDRRKPLETLEFEDLLIVKGEGSIYLVIEKIILNPILILLNCMMCMTSRHTRRNAQGELATFTNQELARLERTNRQQPRQTDTTMGDHANQDDLAAAMALMQQQMQQMQQTIQAQQDAAEQAALAQQEQQAQTGWRTRMAAKSEPPVALRTIMYYLLLRHITISVFKKKKKNEINVMEKGKKEKKHGATGKVEQEVWSCIGWEMNQLEQKRQKTRSNPSDCSEGVFQRQRFLRKQQPISGFALISLFSLPAACDRRKPLETLEFEDLLIVKGKGSIYLVIEKIILNPILILLNCMIFYS
ncbi:hypothetical protein IGI04_003241, partial [Brassica rapa subsp. trilocularis]